MSVIISPFNGVPIHFREFAGDSMSQTEAYENDRVVATRIFDVRSVGVDGLPVTDTTTPRARCGWDQRWNFIRTMFGYPQVRTLLDGGGVPLGDYISRVLPVPYPIVSIGSKPMLYPKDVTRVRGLGPWRWISDPYGGHGAYDEARVEIRYESRPYAVISDFHTPPDDAAAVGVDESRLRRYVEKSWTFVSQALTLPRGGGVWEDTGTLVDDSNIRIVSHIEVVYTWHQVPGIPEAVKTCIGCVNGAAFDGHPAETMLLTACELRPYRWVTGQRLYDIRYKFRFFNPGEGMGHNHFLHYKAQDTAPVYERILVTGAPPGGATGIEGIFKLQVMNSLFRPPLVDLLRDW